MTTRFAVAALAYKASGMTADLKTLVFMIDAVSEFAAKGEGMAIAGKCWGHLVKRGYQIHISASSNVVAFGDEFTAKEI